MRHAQHFTAFNRRDLADDCPPTGTPKTDDILSNDPPLPSIIYRLLPMGNDGEWRIGLHRPAGSVSVRMVWSYYEYGVHRTTMSLLTLDRISCRQTENQFIINVVYLSVLNRAETDSTDSSRRTDTLPNV